MADPAYGSETSLRKRGPATLAKFAFVLSEQNNPHDGSRPHDTGSEGAGAAKFLRQPSVAFHEMLKLLCFRRM